MMSWCIYAGVLAPTVSHTASVHALSTDGPTNFTTIGRCAGPPGMIYMYMYMYIYVHHYFQPYLRAFPCCLSALNDCLHYQSIDSLTWCKCLQRRSPPRTGQWPRRPLTGPPTSPPLDAARVSLWNIIMIQLKPK